MSRGGFSRIYIPHCLDEILPREVKGAAVVNVNELLGKYQLLYAENKSLFFNHKYENSNQTLSGV
jgi:hypothetical protein